MNTLFSSDSPCLLVNQVIWESKIIYWSLPGVMGHLQVLTLAEWYFIFMSIRHDRMCQSFCYSQVLSLGQIFANYSQTPHHNPESIGQVH